MTTPTAILAPLPPVNGVLHRQALSCVAAGLCPLPATRRGAEKRIALPEWKSFQSRLPTTREIDSWFNQPHHSGGAMSLVCGQVSGNLEMIDFDMEGELFPAWSALVEEQAPGLLERLTIESTPSGGRHVVYRCTEAVSGNLKLAQRLVPTDGKQEITLGGKNYVPREVAPGQWAVTVTLIETRGEGGLFLCAPSEGYELLQGDLTAPPVISAEERDLLLGCAWSLDEIAPRDIVGGGTQAGGSTSSAGGGPRPGDDFNRRGDVREILNHHGWTRVRTGENEHWARPGKLRGTSATLRNGVFYVFSSNAPPFDAPKAYAPFAVFTLLEHDGDYAAAAGALAQRGYGTPPEAGADVDLATFRVNGSLVKDGLVIGDDDEPDGGCEVLPPRDPGPLPEHLLQVPGFMGAVIAYNLQTAHRLQPTLALAGALALQSVLCARKVQDERCNRTNLYLLCLAGSGSGKDHSRQVNKNILLLAGLDDLDGNEELASDAGLITAVEEQPAILFQIDEFGRFLRTIGDPRKAPHLFSIVSALMKLYSCAGSVFKGKAYANAKHNKTIVQPCVCMLATTAPEHFREALTPEAMADGFMARLLVFETATMPPRQWPQSVEPPASIIETAKWWGDFIPAGSGNLASAHPKPRIIEADSEARAIFDALAHEAETAMSDHPCEESRSVWARAEEKACRLALLYACSRDHENPRIDGVAARWACELSVHLTKRVLSMAGEYVAYGAFDRIQKGVIRLLRTAGGTMTRSRLCKLTQHLSQRERQGVIANLIETGRLLEKKTPTRGRTKTEYELVGM